MILECEWCGRPFEGVRSSARLCSSTCRARKSRAGGVVPPLKVDGIEVAEAALREFEAARVLHTPEAQAALRLAERIDRSGRSTAKDLASMVAEFRRLVLKLQPVNRAGAGVRDELAVLRARRRGRMNDDR